MTVQNFTNIRSKATISQFAFIMVQQNGSWSSKEQATVAITTARKAMEVTISKNKPLCSHGSAVQPVMDVTV